MCQRRNRHKKGYIRQDWWPGHHERCRSALTTVVYFANLSPESIAIGCSPFGELYSVFMCQMRNPGEGTTAMNAALSILLLGCITWQPFCSIFGLRKGHDEPTACSFQLLHVQRVTERCLLLQALRIGRNVKRESDHIPPLQQRSPVPCPRLDCLGKARDAVKLHLSALVCPHGTESDTHVASSCQAQMHPVAQLGQLLGKRPRQ